MARDIVMVFFGALLINLGSSMTFSRTPMAFVSDANQDNRMKVIVDTDAGGDDAVALLLILAAKKVEVLAITCTYGNTDLENVENNVRKTLTIANRPDIPVFSGAQRPLLNNYTASTYFGEDGFGDFYFDKRITSEIDQSKHASNAMVDLVKKYPGEVNILVLGPLTNVALAASLDSEFTTLVRRFYVMGSKFITKKNKEMPILDFNFGLDPESDAIFLNSPTRLPSFIIPGDLVPKVNISKEWRRNSLGDRKREVMNFLNQAEKVVLANEHTTWGCADSLAAASMIWPELVNKSIKRRATVVIHGPGKGLIYLKQSTHDTGSNNVEIVREIKALPFKKKLKNVLARIPAKTPDSDPTGLSEIMRNFEEKIKSVMNSLPDLY